MAELTLVEAINDCLHHELARDGLVRPTHGGELALPPPRGDYGAFTTAQLELTTAGRELV